MNELDSIAGMDIYLIDQIMKGRYSSGDHILDAGCGGGRNLRWFLANACQVSVCDKNVDMQAELNARYPAHELELQQADLSKLPYADSSFDHVLCNAVLHFASSKEEFIRMFGELIRVCKADGSIFIRCCSNIGMDKDLVEVGAGVYELPDGSVRYLLTKELLADLEERYPFTYLEPLKSVNVSDLRVMSTLVLTKNEH